MAAIDFYKLTEEEKRIIFRAVAEREGLPAYAVEKDWWVVQTLKIIFNLDVGKHLFFKGGTSLSSRSRIPTVKISCHFRTSAIYRTKGKSRNRKQIL